MAEPALITDLAARLFEARRTATEIPAIRGELPAGDIQSAYRVQRINIEKLIAAGARPVGRKIGLTSKAVQQQLGVDAPDFGVLLDGMAYRGDSVDVPVTGLIAPRIEAEIAFVLSSDIRKSPATPADLAPFIGGVAAAAEIVDSAIAGWDIKIVDTVADNASSGAFALGTVQAFAAGMDLPSRTMQLARDGEVVSRGNGAATLGDPLIALAWLAETAIAFGDPLRAGDIILSGALGAMVPFTTATYRIEIDGFARLTVRGVA